MEKISSIIPSNARIKSVDMEDSHPVRPGTPTFGRREGTTANLRAAERDRVSISSKAREVMKQETVAGRNPREDASVKIVDTITRNFFNTRVKPKEEPLSEQVQASGQEVPPALSQQTEGPDLVPVVIIAQSPYAVEQDT
ncbi:MAG: hypothetical protein BroJett040_14480 [Oligoflexia bacterium]|nr:MAG: hypothetical protein BroJett040_14480 [Oligoflexia bacterium]